ncbi:GRXC3, partial [Symbiodinium necroappetens]
MASRGLPAAEIQSSLILELRTALEALSERLGDQSFGKGGDKQAGSDREDRHGFSRLDARAYAHLVVLFSIPCDPGSCLQRLLCDFPSLSRFVGLVEERLPGTWPDYSTFMLALPPEDRPPPPPQSQGSVLAGPVEKRRPEWWELWGWSWGGRKRPVQFGGPGKAPPAIYAICFGMASGLSFAAALACGLGPGRPLALLKQLAEAFADADCFQRVCSSISAAVAMSLAAFAAPSAGRVGKASPGLSGPGLERSHTPDREHLGAHGAGRALLCAPAVCAFLAAFRNKRSIRRQAAKEDAQVQTMERPLLDNVITAGVKALEAAELKRVRSSSESPSDANGNWGGEPREWANSDSITQQISTVSQMGPLAQAKQFIADRLAGEYDAERIGSLIDEKVASNKLLSIDRQSFFMFLILLSRCSSLGAPAADSDRIMMFSFSTCPFCLRAKQILQEDYGEEIEVYECDQE